MVRSVIAMVDNDIGLPTPTSAHTHTHGHFTCEVRGSDEGRQHPVEEGQREGLGVEGVGWRGRGSGGCDRGNITGVH